MPEKTVLCVDDELNILSSLKRMLRREDYRLLTANSGEEALSLIEKETVHLVVSDYRMPVMTGTELLQKVKEKSPCTVRVILSGYADAGVIVDAINKGEIYRFFTKPWNDDELITAIRQCLDQHQLLEENRDLLDKVTLQNKELQLLNEKLGIVVSERTRSLEFSQQILAELDIGILGLCEDGLIAMVNDAVGNKYPSLKTVAVGRYIADVFPSEIACAIQERLNQTAQGETPCFEIDGESIRFSVTPLGRSQALRGYTLLLESVQ